MNAIVSFIASILGYLMDFFFQGLSLIGYPRLWACIVLFAVATRFLFLPQRISGYKSKLLAPVVRQELLDADPNFYDKVADTETTIRRAALKKQVDKKYKLKKQSGCLTSLIQYPLLVALFYIVKNPQEFIPSLEALSSISPEVNTLFGISLSSIPFRAAAGGSTLILVVPLLVMLSNVIKMFPTLKRAQTTVQKLKAYGLCALFSLLLGWLSASLPIAISLYWTANDVTFHIFDFFIHKFVPENKFVSDVLADYQQRMMQRKEDANTATAVVVADSTTDEERQNVQEIAPEADGKPEETVTA